MNHEAAKSIEELLAALRKLNDAAGELLNTQQEFDETAETLIAASQEADQIAHRYEQMVSNLQRNR